MLKSEKLKEKWLSSLGGMTAEDAELLKRAADTLTANIAEGADLPWNSYRCIMPGGPGFLGIWNWDSAFHAIAAARWDAELAKDCILGFMQFQSADGMLPDVIWADGHINDLSSKPPVMPWAAEIVYRRCGGREFIEKLYPMFVKNEEWWCRERSDGGMFYYSAQQGCENFEEQAGWESGWDNSVRWDFARVNELWAIDLNCYMVMFYRAMKFFAEELGFSDDAEKWNAKEKLLADLIEDNMWNEKLHCYCDVNRFTGATSGAVTPAAFMPLFIGTAPRTRAESMNALAADENKFACKMPTVTYDNAAFSENYWRGPVWLNVAYFAAKGLKDYGFDTGEAIKDNILKWCKEDKRGIFENYNSLTGAGMCCGTFSWSAAFIIEFILNF